MKYDLTIIGSGPGGYVAAIRAAQLDIKTAIIEKYDTLGGTCANVGCIPSKALLDSSEHYKNAEDNFADHGIKLTGLKVDLSRLIDRKNEVVEQTVGGVAFLMKKNKIDVFQGTATFVDRNHISILNEDGSTQKIETKNVIIATGSKPICPPDFNYNRKQIITSTEALNILKVPKKMVVIGAGAIGLELGSVFARLGTKIDVVEYLDRIIPVMDKDCSRELNRSLKKLGMKMHLKHMVTQVIAKGNGVVVSVRKRDSEVTFDLQADYCLIAIGRRPYTDGLGLDKIGIKLDEKGFIQVNDNLETDTPGIYAIGDVNGGLMLAHKAEEEGIYVAERLAGQKPHINYNLIPSVVYTWPEVAAVGKAEDQLKADGIPYKTGKFPYRALGRSRASGDIEGMVKVIAHKESDEILGVHIVGARAADMIMEATALMEFRASAEDMARISHPHPTYTEAVREAALAATESRPLHM
jgi:dihydrolipoamide dehydrogenase